MSENRFFTIVLAILSIVIMIMSCLFFPGFIVQDSQSEIIISDLADYWESNAVELPSITKLAVTFSKAKTFRRIGVFLFLIFTLLIEIFVKKRKVAGVVHFVTLILGVTLSWFLLIAVILPFMPL